MSGLSQFQSVFVSFVVHVLVATVFLILTIIISACVASYLPTILFVLSVV